MKNWTITEAKARFRELLERASSEGPQIITRYGRKIAVVVAPREYDRKKTRKGSLADFFAASPLRGSGLVIRRIPGRLQKIK
jgi:prevent-host-death family protein